MKRIVVLTALLGLTLGVASVAPAQGLAAPTSATCDGKPATLVFPSTANSASSIEGTERDDVIVTGPGSESIRGLRGNDVICSRGGNDSIFGGNGDDKLIGGRGSDQIAGRNGLDRALGGRGRDRCFAERMRSCER